MKGFQHIVMLGIVWAFYILMIESCDQNKSATVAVQDIDDSIRAELEPPPAVKIPEDYQPRYVTQNPSDTGSKAEISNETPKTKPQIAKKSISKIPRMEFKELTYNFGDIHEGDVISHNFVFVNKGNAPLEIKQAKASCGCTAPSYPFLAIAPGEQGFIGVRYNSVGKFGDQVADIVVTSNGQPKITTLYLKGFVQAKVDSTQSDSSTISQ